MTQLMRTRASVVMNFNESHYSAIPWDKEGEGSRGVSGGPAQGGDVGATMETQCPVEDRSAGWKPCNAGSGAIPGATAGLIRRSSAAGEFREAA